MNKPMWLLVAGTLACAFAAPAAQAREEAGCPQDGTQDGTQAGAPSRPCPSLDRLPGCSNFPEFASKVAEAAAGMLGPASRVRDCGTRNIRSWAVTNGVATSFYITAPLTDCPITFTCIDAAGGQVAGTASATLELEDKRDGLTFNCAGAQVKADCGEGGEKCRWSWTVNET